MKKISVYFSVILIAFTLVSCSNSERLSMEEIEKLRSDYPFCEEIGQSMSYDESILSDTDMEDMVTQTDGPIVTGIIINEKEKITVDITGITGSERDALRQSINENISVDMGLSTFIIYEIEVSEVIRGDSEVKAGQIIKIAIPSDIDSTEPFRKDLKGLFVLSNFKSFSLLEYYQTSRFGLLYITDDDYVLGAYPNKVSEEYSGISLKYAIREIKKHVK